MTQTSSSTSPRPPREFNFESFSLIAQGHSAFQLMWAGVSLGLFDLLHRRPRLTAPQIAAALGLAAQPARVLVVGLTSLGILVKKGPRYANAPLADRVLVSTAPRSAVPILGWQARIVYPGLQDFVASLKKNANLGLARFPGPGKTLYERLTVHPALEKVFETAMSGLSRQANKDLLNAVDFSRYRRLVDAGGGDGTNAIAIARAHPRLRVTVFESPSVCRMVKRNAAAAGLAARVTAWPGDLFKTPFPPGIDAVLFAHIFSIWSPDKGTRLLRRAHNALPAGGEVLVFNTMALGEESDCLLTALGSPYFQAIATGQGMVYPRTEYEGWLRAAGFSLKGPVLPLPFEHGVLVGRKP